MAYQLEYAFRELKKISFKKYKKINIILSSLLLAATVVCAHFWGAALEVIFLGEQRDIHSAAAEMVINLREGMAFDEAVYVFCEDIYNEEAAN